jgi:hypothetical protein
MKRASRFECQPAGGRNGPRRYFTEGVNPWMLAARRTSANRPPLLLACGVPRQAWLQPETTRPSRRARVDSAAIGDRVMSEEAAVGSGCSAPGGPVCSSIQPARRAKEPFQRLRRLSGSTGRLTLFAVPAASVENYLPKRTRMTPAWHMPDWPLVFADNHVYHLFLFSQSVT